MAETEVQSTLRIVTAIADAIRALGSVPSGHLYARLVGILSLDQYNQIIGILKSQGLVKESCHELIWIG